MLPDRFDLAREAIGELIDTANAPAEIKYCAITFVWGKTESLDVVNIPWYVPMGGKQKFIFIMDACSRRGYEYVWLDVLCTNQDSGTEKDQEVPKMVDYYGKADVTIVIGESWQDFPSLWSNVQTRIVEWKGQWDKEIEVNWPGFQEIDHLLQDQWFWRVWTLQEAVIPLTTGGSQRYDPKRLVTAEGDQVDIKGLCDLIEWSSLALGKHEQVRSKYWWVHPGGGIVNDKNWWRMSRMAIAIDHEPQSLHPIQAVLLTEHRNVSFPVDRLKGLYGMMNQYWWSDKRKLKDIWKEILDKYVAKKEGALLLAMAVTKKQHMTWAAPVFRDEDTEFASFVPDAGVYTLLQPPKVNNTTLELLIAGSVQSDILERSYGDGSGELCRLFDKLNELKDSVDISSVAHLLTVVIQRAGITLKSNSLNDIEEAICDHGNAISSALRSFFSGWNRYIITIKSGTIAFLAWLPLFDTHVSHDTLSLLWLTDLKDEWVVIVEGDLQNGCKKLGIAYVAGLSPLQLSQLQLSQSQVQIL